MNTRKQNKKIIVEKSSGNVFADLNLKKPENYLAKVKLAKQINDLIHVRQLNQVEAAELLEVDQPKISAISRGQLSGFSLERLISLLIKLDQDVKIIVKPKPVRRKTHGHLSVAFG